MIVFAISRLALGLLLRERPEYRKKGWQNSSYLLARAIETKLTPVERFFLRAIPVSLLFGLLAFAVSIALILYAR